CLSLALRRPPSPTLFPYTTLFRSIHAGHEPKFALVGRTNEIVEVKSPEMSVTARCKFTHPAERLVVGGRGRAVVAVRHGSVELLDRKSTRLNSSHVKISYAVFCLK